MIAGQPFTIEITSSEPDADQILRIMAEIVDDYSTRPEIRAFALRVIGNMGHDDRRRQLDAITNFVVKNVLYVRDPIGVEYILTPDRMIKEYEMTGVIRGDCDDHTILANTLLQSVGFETRPIGVKVFRSDVYDHTISEIKMDNGKWYTFDGCRKDDPFKQYPPGAKLVLPEHGGGMDE